MMMLQNLKKTIAPVNIKGLHVECALTSRKIKIRVPSPWWWIIRQKLVTKSHCYMKHNFMAGLSFIGFDKIWNNVENKVLNGPSIRLYLAAPRLHLFGIRSYQIINPWLFWFCFLCTCQNNFKSQYQITTELLLIYNGGTCDAFER